MGNSHGRSCGSVSAGDYGATGFAPTEGGTVGLQVHVWSAPIAGKEERKASAAVVEVKDAAGKVTTAASPAVEAQTEVKAVASKEHHFEHKAREHDTLGNVLASVLHNADKALTEDEEKAELRFETETEAKRVAEQTNKDNKAATPPKAEVPVPAVTPKPTDFESRRASLRAYKAGWAAYRAVLEVKDKEGKVVTAAAGASGETADLNKKISDLKLAAGQSVIFAYDGAAAVADGHIVKPAAPVAVVATTGGTSSSSSSTAAST